MGHRGKEEGGAVMRFLILIGLACVAIPSSAHGQKFPPVTEEGKKAANELIETCKQAGAIKEVADPKTKRSLFVVADAKGLKGVIQQHRQLLTPAAINAL